MADEFGPLISEETVQDAVLALLSTAPFGGSAPLVVYYLAEIERQVGLAQQALDAPLVYRGGTDFEVWQGDESPTIIVVVEPENEPEIPEPGVYGQRFEINAGVILRSEEENDARWRARYYGLAIAAAIAQNAHLGTNPYDNSLKLATETIMTRSPVTTFAADSNTSRNIMRSVVTFETLVMPTLVAWSGPKNFPASPYTPPGDWPVIDTVNVTVDAVPPAT